MSENAKEMFPKILITLFRIVGLPDFESSEDQQSISQLKVVVPQDIILLMNDPDCDVNTCIAEWVDIAYPGWFVAIEKPQLMNEEQYFEWRMKV